MDMKTMKRRVLIAAGLIGLPVITWALLAWEPFDRLLGHFFPEMFYDNLGRFVPYTPIDAMAATIVLAVYAAVPIAVILLVVGTVRSVRKNGTEKTVTTVEKGVEATAVGIVTVLSALATAMIAVAGFAAREIRYIQEEDYDDIDRTAEREPWDYDEYDWDSRSMPNHSPPVIPDKGLFHN